MLGLTGSERTQEVDDMRRAITALVSGFILGFMLIGSAYLIVTVKAHSEQRQEQRQQELQEYIDQSVNECNWAYPLDLISKYQCIERLLG